MSNVEKTREQILAERQEKKKKKAALKNQSKVKDKSAGKECSDPEKSKVESSIKAVKNHSEEKIEKCKTSSDTVKESISFDSAKCNTQIDSSRNTDNSQSFTVSSKNASNKKEPDKNVENGSKRVQPVTEESNSKEDAIKTKAQLKAERRAKQEAERARKVQKASNTLQDKKTIFTPALTEVIKIKKPTSTTIGSSAGLEVNRKVKLFAHLYDVEANIDVVDTLENIHPSIIQLRTQFSSRVVSGANACCLALLNALKKVVMDFETPSNQEFSRGLESEITKCMSYLSNQRPLAVSMMNAVKHLKFRINQSKGNDLECKNNISDWIDTYIKEQLEMAAKAICLFVREKITSHDVILTYGWSSLIYQILISAYNEGIKFRVIVADGRPWLEGRELLKKLVKANIQCTYVFVNGLSFVMPEVTKILLGAHALLANGYVMSRVGSSQVALLAKTYNVPVLVCCETHKFSERVQTDSFVYNELGNPDDLASNKGCLSKELSKWRTIHSLTPLNLMYDLTPPDLVTAVVTEIAVLPCTSVPVILRIKPPDFSF